MTIMATYPQGYSGSLNVLGVINHFLIELSSILQEELHLQYCECGHKSVVGEFQTPSIDLLLLYQMEIVSNYLLNLYLCPQIYTSLITPLC